MSGDDIVERLRAEVVPCPGKGWDGNGVQHCAECCFGTGVDAATADELRVMVLARDAADTIKNLTAEVERLRAENAELAQGWRAERALADQLADALGNEWPGISNKPYSDVSTAHAATTAALSAWQEARREQ